MRLLLAILTLLTFQTVRAEEEAVIQCEKRSGHDYGKLEVRKDKNKDNFSYSVYFIYSKTTAKNGTEVQTRKIAENMTCVQDGVLLDCQYNDPITSTIHSAYTEIVKQYKEENKLKMVLNVQFEEENIKKALDFISWPNYTKGYWELSFEASDCKALN